MLNFEEKCITSLCLSMNPTEVNLAVFLTVIMKQNPKTMPQEGVKTDSKHVKKHLATQILASYDSYHFFKPNKSMH